MRFLLMCDEIFPPASMLSRTSFFAMLGMYGPTSSSSVMSPASTSCRVAIAVTSFIMEVISKVTPSGYEDSDLGIDQE